jgi:hypothetical protein
MFTNLPLVVTTGSLGRQQTKRAGMLGRLLMSAVMATCSWPAVCTVANCSTATGSDTYALGNGESCYLNSTLTVPRNSYIVNGTLFVNNSLSPFLVQSPGNLTLGVNGSVISTASKVFSELHEIGNLRSSLESTTAAGDMCRADLQECKGTAPPPSEMPVGTLPPNSSLAAICQVFDNTTAQSVFNFSFNLLAALDAAGGYNSFVRAYSFNLSEDA